MQEESLRRQQELQEQVGDVQDSMLSLTDALGDMEDHLLAGQSYANEGIYMLCRYCSA